jgi:hypothetical protein
MANDIRVHVITQAGDTHPIDAPPDIKTDDFIREVVLGLNLPKVDAEGHPINWRIDNKDTGKPLEGQHTLAECGVQTGHHLHMWRRIIAGGRSGSSSRI